MHARRLPVPLLQLQMAPVVVECEADEGRRDADQQREDQRRMSGRDSSA
jgi:hypothetical protein